MRWTRCWDKTFMQSSKLETGSSPACRVVFFPLSPFFAACFARKMCSFNLGDLGMSGVAIFLARGRHFHLEARLPTPWCRLHHPGLGEFQRAQWQALYASAGVAGRGKPRTGGNPGRKRSVVKPVLWSIFLGKRPMFVGRPFNFGVEVNLVWILSTDPWLVNVLWSGWWGCRRKSCQIWDPSFFAPRVQSIIRRRRCTVGPKELGLWLHGGPHPDGDWGRTPTVTGLGIHFAFEGERGAKGAVGAVAFRWFDSRIARKVELFSGRHVSCWLDPRRSSGFAVLWCACWLRGVEGRRLASSFHSLQKGRKHLSGPQQCLRPSLPNRSGCYCRRENCWTLAICSEFQAAGASILSSWCRVPCGGCQEHGKFAERFARPMSVAFQEHSMQKLLTLSRHFAGVLPQPCKPCEGAASRLELHMAKAHGLVSCRERRRRSVDSPEEPATDLLWESAALERGGQRSKRSTCKRQGCQMDIGCFILTQPGLCPWLGCCSLSVAPKTNVVSSKTANLTEPWLERVVHICSHYILFYCWR